MGFVWVQDISIGADIDSVDIVEIRDAADFVLDNLCVVDNVGENVGENGLDLLGEDGLDLDAEDGAENSNDNPAEDGAEDTDDNPAEDGVVNTVDNPALNGPDNLAQDGSALGANQSPDNIGEDGGDRNPYYNAALDGEDFEEDTLDHTFNWATNYPTAVLDEYGAGDDSAAQSNV